ncbi:hypothetical protein GJ744_007864 [Endocarpon pusillum]|uniref:Hemolysin-III channel protein Izh2 n=1 Tax=Endocarpon pusillum TaxID=364733 RepID=A0A8H7ARC3_9EURO|nr:hypothetical protein GJ744_007864 [Endocarpon pusillum]
MNGIMNEEGESGSLDAALEEGLLNTPTTPSMTSHRKRAALKTESENSNGFPNGEAQHISSHRATCQKRLDLIRYDELPAWYKDNEYIIGGYRPESFSTSTCFASLTYIHNETVNIYTHMIPAIVFLFAQSFMLVLLRQKFPDAKPLDYIVFSFFLLSACITMSLSFLYHTLMNHSMGVSYLWLRLDYVGILALVLGDFISGIRVGFYCEPTLQKIYWSMTIALGILTSILVIHPKYFQGLEYRNLRVTAFVTLALSCFIPLAHGLIIYGWNRMWLASGMPYYLAEGGILVLSAFFYGTRWPESIRPGRFDIWGCSHNIFHVLVVLATVVHLVGIWNAFAYNYRQGRC